MEKQALRIFTATELRAIAEEVYEQRIADMEERVRDTVSILEWRSFHDRISALEEFEKQTTEEVNEMGGNFEERIGALETRMLHAEIAATGWNAPAPSPAEPRCAYVTYSGCVCNTAQDDPVHRGPNSHPFTPAPEALASPLEPPARGMAYPDENDPFLYAEPSCRMRPDNFPVPPPAASEADKRMDRDLAIRLANYRHIEGMELSASEAGESDEAFAARTEKEYFSGRMKTTPYEDYRSKRASEAGEKKHFAGCAGGDCWCPSPAASEAGEEFYCLTCGPRVKADEDGCCVHCGRDAEVRPAPPSREPKEASQVVNGRWFNVEEVRQARTDAAEVKRLRAQVERVRALLETVPYGCEYDAIVKIKDALRDEE